VRSSTTSACAHALVDVALLDEVRLEDVVLAPDHRLRGERLLEVEDRRQLLDVERHRAARLLEQVAVGVGEQQHRLLGVVDDAVGEAGLVLEDQGDAVLPRHVARVDDDDLLPRNAVAEVDARTRPRATGCARWCRRASLAAQVVDVARGAGDLLAPSLRGTGLPISAISRAPCRPCRARRGRRPAPLAHELDHRDAALRVRQLAAPRRSRVVEAHRRGIGRAVAEVDALGPRPVDGAEAHRAGLAAGVEVAAVELERAERAAGLADRHDLGVRGGVVGRRHLVGALGENGAVLDDQRRERPAAGVHVGERQLDGAGHEAARIGGPRRHGRKLAVCRGCAV
jgi:hypothetical protein